MSAVGKDKNAQGVIADITLDQVIESNGLDAKRILQLIEDEDFE